MSETQPILPGFEGTETVKVEVEETNKLLDPAGAPHELKKGWPKRPRKTTTYQQTTVVPSTLRKKPTKERRDVGTLNDTETEI